MRNLRLDTSKHLHLNDLRLGRLADDERCGRVGSEDVGSGRLLALYVVTVTGVVPGTFYQHTIWKLQKSVFI